MLFFSFFLFFLSFFLWGVGGSFVPHLRSFKLSNVSFVFLSKIFVFIFLFAVELNIKLEINSFISWNPYEFLFIFLSILLTYSSVPTSFHLSVILFYVSAFFSFLQTPFILLPSFLYFHRFFNMVPDKKERIYKVCVCVSDILSETASRFTNEISRHNSYPIPAIGFK